MLGHELAERLLAASRASHTIVIVNSTESVNTRWARNELTTNGHTKAGDVTLIAIHEGDRGPQVASLSRAAAGVDPVEFADQALEQARRSAPAWDAQPLLRRSQAASQGWRGAASDVAIAEVGPTLAALGAQIAADADEGREHFGYLEFSRTSHWLATSSGLALRHDQPAARLEMTVKSHHRSRSTWQGYAGADLSGADVASMAGRARLELGWQERAFEVAPGHRTAVLSPSAVADLMVDVLFGADALAATQGRSVFSGPDGGTQLGQALSSRPLRLWSDPGMPRQQGAPFLLTEMSHDASSVFDNGLPLPHVDWVADGRLAALVSSRAVAAATGLPIAPAPDNLALDAAGAGSVDDVLARTEDGLLITCTWYNRMVDPQTHLVTGLTRDGVYLVRGGEVIGRAGNFRFNESPVAMLQRISDASAATPALGREMGDSFTRTTMPALTVAGFNLSSASEAV